MYKVESYLEIAVHEEVRIERCGKPYVRILPYTLPKSKEKFLILNDFVKAGAEI